MGNGHSLLMQRSQFLFLQRVSKSDLPFGGTTSTPLEQCPLWTASPFHSSACGTWTAQTERNT